MGVYVGAGVAIPAMACTLLASPGGGVRNRIPWSHPIILSRLNPHKASVVLCWITRDRETRSSGADPAVPAAEAADPRVVQPVHPRVGRQKPRCLSDVAYGRPLDRVE